AGTGRDAALLLERLPRGRVLAADASPAMLARLRERFAAEARVTVVAGDLTRPLAVDAPVDAVISVAAFHWIDDHDALFRSLAAVMRPGARLVSDCGGFGNIASVVRAIGTDAVAPWHFAAPEPTRRRLAAAGFRDVEVALRPDPARLESREQLVAYLGIVVLGAHLERLAPEERAAFVGRVADALDEPVIDYVRLEIAATRG
ncbi:MAG: methyltransferase domain-containing protein, partial [Chloroflexi bacterium]|nr:methyltransferase domain-containing protein [Chloroflexota bacterium]